MLQVFVERAAAYALVPLIRARHPGAKTWILTAYREEEMDPKWLDANLCDRFVDWSVTAEDLLREIG